MTIVLLTSLICYLVSGKLEPVSYTMGDDFTAVDVNTQFKGTLIRQIWDGCFPI